MLYRNNPGHISDHKTLFVCVTVFLLNTLNSSAIVSLNITAASPSATQITITAGPGTNTVADTAISGRSGAAGFLPVGSSWSGNTGNMQMVGLDPNFTTANFSLNGVSTLQYTHNGVPFGVILNDVETYQETIGYQFRIGPGSTMTYPAMSIGDTYGYTGSVTYDLTGGMTAGAFTNGSFNNPINGGNFVWSVAVPEPSTYAALFGGIALLVVGCRRLSARRMIQ